MNTKPHKHANIRRTRHQIQQLVGAFHNSGQTIRAFAKQQGVALSTVGRWLRTERHHKTPRLVEVERIPGSHHCRIGQLRLSHGLVLELERGFEVEPVARLVQLLEER